MVTVSEGLLDYQVIEPLLGLFPARLIPKEMTLVENLSYTLLLQNLGVSFFAVFGSLLLVYLTLQ